MSRTNVSARSVASHSRALVVLGYGKPGLIDAGAGAEGLSGMHSAPLGGMAITQAGE